MIRFDHAIILVKDLTVAMTAFRSIGFTVEFGGVHADGKTHNALIVFADGSYLELLAPTNPALLAKVNRNDRGNFLFLFAAGEGWGGYALAADDVAAQATAAIAQGVALEVRPPGGRARPDGVALRWQSATVGESMSPFLIQDLTPRHLRVPDDRPLVTHANRALGTVSLTVAIPAGRFDAAVMRLTALTGVAPQTAGKGRVDFVLGDFRLMLQTFATNEISERILSLTLRGERDLSFEAGQTHGAALRIQADV
jgi:hypothetical protein